MMIKKCLNDQKKREDREKSIFAGIEKKLKQKNWKTWKCQPFQMHKKDESIKNEDLKQEKNLLEDIRLLEPDFCSCIE